MLGVPKRSQCDIYFGVFSMPGATLAYIKEPTTGVMQKGREILLDSIGTVKDYSTFPEPLIKILESELNPDETVYWLGQPYRKHYMWKGIVFLGFGISVGIVAIAQLLILIYNNSSLVWPAYFLGSLAAFVIAFPIWWYRRKAKYILYAVTSTRAIIIEGKKSYKIKSYYPDNLKKIERTMKNLDLGSIIFERLYSDSGGDIYNEEFGFFSILNVKIVHDIILKVVDNYDSNKKA